MLTETFQWLSKVIYDGIWSASVCFDLFRSLSWTPEDKIGHKQAKNSRSYSPKPTLLPWYCAETQNLLFFAYLWQIFASSDQDKHLNRSKHTLADQFPSYMTLRESLGMPQHNINVPKLAFWNLGGQIGYFLLIVDQMLVLETNINI